MFESESQNWIIKIIEPASCMYYYIYLFRFFYFFVTWRASGYYKFWQSCLSFLIIFPPMVTCVLASHFQSFYILAQLMRYALDILSCSLSLICPTCLSLSSDVKAIQTLKMLKCHLLNESYFIHCQWLIEFVSFEWMFRFANSNTEKL